MEHVATLVQALELSGSSEIAVTISAAADSDQRLLFANYPFCQLTGYMRSEVEGQNCRFLQGAETDRGAVASIRSQISTGYDGDTCLLNYRKDGSEFMNFLSIRHFEFKDNRRLILGFQYEVPLHVGRSDIERRLGTLDVMMSMASGELGNFATMTVRNLRTRSDNAMLTLRHLLKRRRLNDPREH